MTLIYKALQSFPNEISPLVVFMAFLVFSVLFVTFMPSQNKQNCELWKNNNNKKKHDTKSSFIKLQILQGTREHKSD